MGSFLEVINREVEGSHQLLLKVTQNLTADSCV